MPAGQSTSMQSSGAGPSLSLPEAGKLTGYGETFSPNDFTGTASFTLPLTITPCVRSQPELALRYTSGEGRGPFGLGVSLDLPSFSRRTSQGIPRYEGTDTFVYSGTQVLVPRYELTADSWVRDERRELVDGHEYQVLGYRPRVEGDFTRIEHWVDERTRRSFWKTLDSRNQTSLFGVTGDAQVHDPDDPSRIFQWLLEETTDAHGNKIRYQYKREDSQGVPETIYEQGRSVGAGRYLEKVFYGNHRGPEGTERFAFELLFDYGEYQLPDLTPVRPWLMREDPFSTYRAGFEIRTYRLCRNILMVHHFPEKLGTPAVLVNALRLEYDSGPERSLLRSIQRVGYRRMEDGIILEQQLPPLELSYSHFEPEQQHFQPFSFEVQPAPGLLDGGRYFLIDLYGEGLPGILYTTGNSVLYWPAKAKGVFGPAQTLPAFPSEGDLSERRYALLDLNGNGHLDLVVGQAQRGGFYGNNNDGSWRPYRDFASYTAEFIEPSAQLTDMDGDGRADLLVMEARTLRYYPSRGELGYSAPMVVARDPDLPGTTSPGEANVLVTTDLFGDGLAHRVRVSDGIVEAWPNLGHGHFGGKVTLGNAPRFAAGLTPSRILMGDVSGSGTADLLFAYEDHLELYLNQSGNSFSAAIRLEVPIRIDDLDQLNLADISGSGVSSLVVSKAQPTIRHFFLKFSGGRRPFLLESIRNNLGARTEIHYRSSVDYYLAARDAGCPWTTRLAFPVQVISRTETVDELSGTRMSHVFQYRDGYFDAEEREFRGFGYVQTQDTQTFNAQLWHFPMVTRPIQTLETTPAEPGLRRSWNNTGTFLSEEGLARRTAGRSGCDPEALELPDNVFDPEILAGSAELIREAYRALASTSIRHELYGLEPDGSLPPAPYQIAQANYTVRLLQPRLDGNNAVFLVSPRESATSHYERVNDDPSIEHSFHLEVDAYGNPVRIAKVFYARRQGPDVKVLPNQALLKATVELSRYINHRGPDFHLLGYACEARELELGGISPEPGRYFSFDALARAVSTALEDSLPYGEPFTPGRPQARLFQWQETYYWNAALTEPLPLGGIVEHALVHHERSAVFTQKLIERMFEHRVTPAVLEASGYILAQDYWWNPGSRQVYYDTSRHYLAAATVDPFGQRTTYDYDSPHDLMLVSIEDALEQKTRGEIDYQVMRLSAVTSANENTTEVLYDPLGEVIVTSLHGMKGGQLVGNMPLAEYVRQPPATMERILQEPARYLQGASSFHFYDLWSWSRGTGQPIHTLFLVRNDWVHPPPGNNATASVPDQLTIEYFNGALHPITRKSAVELEAVPPEERPPSAGDLVWVTTGQVVYNDRFEVVRRYLPNFTTGPEYTSSPTVPSFHYTFDALGREIRTENPQGTFSRTEYGSWAREQYDEEDTDPQSPFYDTPTRWELDAQGHELQETRINVLEKDGKRELQFLHIDYWPDIAGNRLWIADPRFHNESDPSKPFHYSFVNVFDMTSRQLSTWSADAGPRLILEDPMSAVLHVWDGRGFHTTFAYDALRRPISVFVEGNGLSQYTERLTYGTDPQLNNRNEVVTHLDQAGILNSPEYDLLGHSTREERELLRDCLPAVNWNKPEQVPFMPERWVIQRQYDSTSRLSREINADRSIFEPAIYRNGWLKRVAITFAGTTAAQDVIRGITYNALGNHRTELLGNGVEVRYTYEPLSQRLASQVAFRGGTPDDAVQDLRYTYDRVGNVVQVENLAARVSAGAGNSGTPVTSTYTYNALYQLKVATGRQQPEAFQADCRPGSEPPLPPGEQTLEPYKQRYAYDLSGNLVMLEHSTASGEMTCELSVSESSNRAVPKNILEGHRPDEFFDANGNQRSLLPLSQGQKLEFNSSNRLVLDADPPGSPTSLTTCFLQDSSGLRLRKVVERTAPGTPPAILQDTLYIGSLVVVRTVLTDAASSETTQVNSLRIAANDHVVLVARMTPSSSGTEPRQERYQFDNQVASVTLELDAAANVLTYEEYFPYGLTAVTEGDARDIKQKRYRFNGKELDPSSSLYYYGQRYYAPWQMRWLNPDPSGTTDGLNLYAFVNGNPITVFDPTGLGGKNNTQTTKPPPSTPTQTFFNAAFPAFIFSLVQWPGRVLLGAQLTTRSISGTTAEKAQIAREKQALIREIQILGPLFPLNKIAGLPAFVAKPLLQVYNQWLKFYLTPQTFLDRRRSEIVTRIAQRELGKRSESELAGQLSGTLAGSIAAASFTRAVILRTGSYIVSPITNPLPRTFPVRFTLGTLRFASWAGLTAAFTGFALQGLRQQVVNAGNRYNQDHPYKAIILNSSGATKISSFIKGQESQLNEFKKKYGL
ncbi:hypothetical protein HI113_03820 [Corallococcus exiguus]|uniref:SpvB/TcaC N-terminal domain-containing protein n=1 Tax=Corallococcus exiguus TaxID=83462 RepID=UPI0014743EDB|nr:SpvB/TcaC N-terminal domain-containing protein [Corallococcus exiguus]NNB93038.1 hypothetical protein [Corallococcus exiguus]